VLLALMIMQFVLWCPRYTGVAAVATAEITFYAL